MVLEVITARLVVTAEPEWVVTGFETGWDVTALERGEAFEMTRIQRKHRKKRRNFALSLILFISNQSEGNFFSLWYVISHLYIRKRHWNRIRTIHSPYNLYKSESIRLRWDLKAISTSLRNSLKQFPNIRANFQNRRELLNKITFKKMFLNKHAKQKKRGSKHLSISLKVLVTVRQRYHIVVIIPQVSIMYNIKCYNLFLFGGMT